VDRCPLCRAALNGAETCRRCQAELGMAQRAEREGQALADAAMHSLSLDDPNTAERLLRRALALLQRRRPWPCGTSWQRRCDGPTTQASANRRMDERATS